MTQDGENRLSFTGNLQTAEEYADSELGKGPVSINEDGSANVSYSHATWDEINQAELIKDLVRTLGVSKKKAKRWVDQVF